MISCKFFYVQEILYCGRKESVLPRNWCVTEIYKQNCLPLTFLSKCVILSRADFHWHFLWPFHDFLETMSPRLRQIKQPDWMCPVSWPLHCQLRRGILQVRQRFQILSWDIGNNLRLFQFVISKVLGSRGQTYLFHCVYISSIFGVLPFLL